MKLFRIAKLNLLHWHRNHQYAVVLLYLIFYGFNRFRGLAYYASDLGVKITPWVFPFLPCMGASFLPFMLGHLGSDAYFEPPVYFDYGYNTYIGDHFYSNHNLTVLDTGRITIGDHVFIGPNVGIYAPAHPLDIETRNAGLESAADITIGNNVWIGGSVCILPGVHIGSGAVIGAGSVVTRDIPPNVVAVGNPCVPIREIPQAQEITR